MNRVLSYLSPRSLALVLVVVVPTIQGCFLRRNQPIQPQTATSSCGAVAASETAHLFVVNRGQRTSLMLPSLEVVEQLGWMIDEVHNAPWIEVGWGEIDELVDQSQIVSNPDFERFAQMPLVSARGMASEPSHQVEHAELVKLTLTKEALARIAGGIKRCLAPSESGASTVAYSSVKQVGTFYRGVEDPGAGSNQVRWIAQRLREGGCTVDLNSTRISTVLAGLNPAPVRP